MLGWVRLLPWWAVLALEVSEMTNRSWGLAAIASVLLLVVAVAPAGANPITFGAASGGLGAQVTFSVTGSDLLVHLVNTDQRVFTGTNGTQALQPSEVLTALYFTLSGATSLSPVNMSVESVVNGSGVPGENWQYLANLSGAPNGAVAGISSTGLGLFGPTGNFASPGQTLDGVAWGIVGDHYTPGTGVGNLPTDPLVLSYADFRLAGLPAGFKAQSISDVAFQWGTSQTEPQLIGVVLPEPSTLWLLLTGIAFAVVVRRRSRVRQLRMFR